MKLVSLPFVGIAGLSLVATFAAPVAADDNPKESSASMGAAASLNAPVPKQAQASKKVKFTQVSAGFDHSLAIGNKGKAYAWGDNYKGALGDGTTRDRKVPVRVKLPANTAAKQVSAGANYSMVLTTKGKVYSWGENYEGALGDGTLKDRKKPVRVKLPKSAKFKQIDAAYYLGLALSTKGKVYSWGWRYLNNRITSQKTPKQVMFPSKVKIKQVTTGGIHSLALTTKGKVYAWGVNAQGQIGDGTRKDRKKPVQVKFPSKVKIKQISAGGSFSVALTTKGHVYAWGHNEYGQLGNKSWKSRKKPVRVKFPANTVVKQISAGGIHTLARVSNRKVYAWGDNEIGQLGDGTMKTWNRPVRVKLPIGVKSASVSGGRSHSLLLDKSGAIYAWGNNYDGQLGIGSTKDRNKPARVKAPKK